MSAEQAPNAPIDDLATIADVVVDADLAPDLEVEALLRREKGGAVASSLGNAIAILSRDPRWAGRIRLDEFAGLIELRGDGDAWRELREADGIHAAEWIERAYSVALPPRMIHDAFIGIADRNRIHPVRAYLDTLEWDGRPRLRGLLADYLGAEASELHSEISRCFLVSCVARILDPGCKVDTVLILVGKQGRHKSSALEILAGAWFSDTKIDPGDKDAYQSLPGRWVYELAEMETWGAHAWGRIKAFLSSRVDRYRPSYGRVVASFPRQTVFVGSTNQREFLADPTGARRFWPVTVPGKIDRDKLRADRDQLWAEALTEYRSRPVWWLSEGSEEAQAAQAAEHTIQDPWHATIARWAESRVGFEISEVLTDALRKPIADHDKHAQGRAAEVLRSLGFESKREGSGLRRKLWHRKTEESR